MAFTEEQWKEVDMAQCVVDKEDASNNTLSYKQLQKAGEVACVGTRACMRCEVERCSYGQRPWQGGAGGEARRGTAVTCRACGLL